MLMCHLNGKKVHDGIFVTGAIPALFTIVSWKDVGKAVLIHSCLMHSSDHLCHWKHRSITEGKHHPSNYSKEHTAEKEKGKFSSSNPASSFRELLRHNSVTSFYTPMKQYSSDLLFKRLLPHIRGSMWVWRLSLVGLVWIFKFSHEIIIFFFNYVM